MQDSKDQQGNKPQISASRPSTLTATTINSPTTDEDNIQSSSLANSTIVHASHLNRDWTDIEQKFVKEFYNLHDLGQDQWMEDELHVADTDTMPSAAMTRKGVNIELARDRYISKNSGSIAQVDHVSSYNQLLEPTSTYYDASFVSGIPILEEDQHQDPLRLKGNMSKHLMITGKDEDEDLFDAVLISSKSFQPTTFLKTLHKNTHFQDMEKGLENLQDSLEEKIESMKNLFKQNFERFVNAKMVIDDVYDVMKKKVFNRPETELNELFQSISKWKGALKAALEPILLVKQESGTLTRKLHVIQQFKFLFQLPVTLRSAIQLNQVDVAINDYRRGKAMIKSALNQSQDGQATFHKLSKCIESSARQMKSTLFDRLEDPKSELDAVEKYVMCLLEIEPTDEAQRDPVMHYITSQEKCIHESLDGIKNNFSSIESLYTSSKTFIDENISFKIFMDQLASLVDYPITEEHGISPLASIWDSKDVIIKQLCDLIHGSITPFWIWSLSVINGKYKSLYNNERLGNNVTKVFDHITLSFSSLLLRVSSFVIESHENENTPKAMSWDIITSGKSICNIILSVFSAMQNSEYPGMKQLWKCFIDINAVIIKGLLSKVQGDMTFFSLLLTLFHHNTSKSGIHQESMRTDLSPDTYKKILSDLSSFRLSNESCSFPTRAFCVWSQRIFQECYDLMTTLAPDAQGTNKEKDIDVENAHVYNIDADKRQLISQSIGELLHTHWRGYIYCVDSNMKSVMINAQSKELLVQSLIFIIKDVDWLRDCFSRTVQICIGYQIPFEKTEIHELITSIENEAYIQLVKTLGEKFVSLIQGNFIDSPVLCNDSLFPTGLRGYVFEILMDIARLRFEMESALNHEKSELLVAKLDLLLFHEMKDCLVDDKNIRVGGFIQVYMELQFFHKMLLPNQSHSLPDALRNEQEALWNDISQILEQIRNRLTIPKPKSESIPGKEHSAFLDSGIQYSPHIELDDNALKSATEIVIKAITQCLYLSNIFQ